MEKMEHISRDITKIAKKLRRKAEDLEDERSRDDASDAAFHAGQLRDLADELDVLSTNIHGSGTGDH